MKRIQFILVFTALTLVLSCKKEKINENEEPWNIQYELQTEATGFSEMRYVMDDGTTWGKFEDWSVTTTGTFSKKVQLKQGMLAEFRGGHPSSNKWKLVIKDKNGTILKQTTMIHQLGTAPFSYYANLSVEVQ